MINKIKTKMLKCLIQRNKIIVIYYNKNLELMYIILINLIVTVYFKNLIKQNKLRIIEIQRNKQ